MDPCPRAASEPGAPANPPVDRSTAVAATTPSSASEPLASLRRLWVIAAVAILLLATVVVLSSDAASTVPAALPVLLTLAVAAGAVAGVVAVDRSLAATPPADPDHAVAEVRTRAFLQLAILEAPLLLGVALGFTLGPSWVAAVGAAGALVALALSWPSSARLERLTSTWRASGAEITRDGHHGPAGDG
jgi:hypothetical protein